MAHLKLSMIKTKFHFSPIYSKSYSPCMMITIFVTNISVLSLKEVLSLDSFSFIPHIQFVVYSHHLFLYNISEIQPLTKSLIHALVISCLNLLFSSLLLSHYVPSSLFRTLMPNHLFLSPDRLHNSFLPIPAWLPVHPLFQHKHLVLTSFPLSSAYLLFFISHHVPAHNFQSSFTTQKISYSTFNHPPPKVLQCAFPLAILSARKSLH